jgi:tetratricopeptide (TPR) repeat protein
VSEALQKEIRHLRSLEGSPRDPDGRIFLPLADAHLRAGDVSEAERLIADGLARHPDFVAAHVLAARVRLSNGDEEGAEVAYAAARRLDPDNVEVLHGLGSILAGRGEEIGVMLVEQACSLDPTVAVARGAAPGSHADDTGADIVSIADLAPDGPDHAAGTPAGVAGDDEVVSIAALAPDPDHDVVSIADLAPDPAPGGATPDSAVAPDVPSIEELAPAEDVIDEPEQGRPAAEQEPPAAEQPAPSAPAAPPAPATAPTSATTPARPNGERGLATKTLAELLAAQGQRKEAVEMYERLVAANPADAGLAARLADLRAEGGLSAPRSTEPEEDEGDDGTPLGDYLGGLLGYTPPDRPGGA